MSGGQPRNPSFTLLVMLDLVVGLNYGISLTDISGASIPWYNAQAWAGSVAVTGAIISALTSALVIGALFGSLCTSLVAGRFGLRRCVVGYASVCALLNAVTCLPVHWGFLFSFRVLTGFAMSGVTSILPMWLSEMAEPRRRGVLTFMFQLFVNLGILLNFSVGYALAAAGALRLWYVCIVIAAAFNVCAAVLAAFCVETRQAAPPRAAPDSGAAPRQGGWGLVFRDRRYARALVLAVFLPLAQQMGGVNAILMYAGVIFTDLGLPNIDALGAFLIGLWNFLASLLATLFIDRLGRRVLMLGGLGLTLVGDVVLSFGYGLPGLSGGGRTACIAVGAAVFLFGFSVGPGPVVFVVAGEVFPSVVRPQLSSLCFGGLWVFNLVVVFVFPYFGPSLVWVSFLLFAVFTAVIWAVMFLTLYETRGRSLAEIEGMMLGGRVFGFGGAGLGKYSPPLKTPLSGHSVMSCPNP